MMKGICFRSSQLFSSQLRSPRNHHGFTVERPWFCRVFCGAARRRQGSRALTQPGGKSSPWARDKCWINGLVLDRRGIKTHEDVWEESSWEDELVKP